MPTHRQDLSRLSLSDLERLTGHDRRTLRKRLAGLEPAGGDGRTVLFDSRSALERIYLGDSLDLTRERARLAAAQAEAQEMKNAVERQELGTWGELEDFVVRIFSACVQRLEAVPSKVAPEAHGAATIAATEAVIRRAIHDARSELADVLSGKRPWRAKAKRSNGEAAAEPAEGATS